MTTELTTEVVGMLPEDYTPPEFKLTQKTSPFGTAPGKFYHTLRKDEKDQVCCFVVRLAETRTLWGRDEISSDAPECSSDNAASYRSRDGRDCLQCADRCDNPWDFEASARRAKCLKGFTIVGIDLEENEPFLMRVSGMSVASVREFASALKFRSLRGDVVPSRVVLGSASRGTKYGETHVLEISVDAPLNDEEIKRVAPLAAELRSLPQANLTQPALGETPTKEEEIAPLTEVLTKPLETADLPWDF